MLITFLFFSRTNYLCSLHVGGAITGSLSMGLFVSYFVLSLLSGAVHTPMYLHKGTYLFLFFYCVFSLLNCKGPLGFLQNYLVLIIVYDIIMYMVVHGGSFVNIQAVEHNWKKMTFFPGFALDFFINLTKVSLWVCPYFATFWKMVHGLIDSKIP